MPMIVEMINYYWQTIIVIVMYDGNCYRSLPLTIHIDSFWNEI